MREREGERERRRGQDVKKRWKKSQNVRKGGRVREEHDKGGGRQKIEQGN